MGATERMHSLFVPIVALVGVVAGRIATAGYILADSDHCSILYLLFGILVNNGVTTISGEPVVVGQ